MILRQLSHPARKSAYKALTLALVSTFTVLIFGTVAAAAQDSTASSSTEIYVREIRTDPSKIFSEVEIHELVAPYQNRIVRMDDLLELIDHFNARYAERGYVTARAILPAQTIDDGIVRIALVEGVVGAVLVEGNTSTRSAYVTKRMSLHPGDLVQLGTLERDIAHFNATNDIQLRAQLRPGAAFGTTDYVLHAIEPPRWLGTVYYANTGRDEVGADQTGLVATDRSLFGFRDRLSLTVLTAAGTSGGSVGYSFPIGRAGSRIGATYYRNEIEIIAGGFAGVNVAGASSGGSLVLNSPLVVLPETRVTSSVAYHVRESGTYFDGSKLIGNTVRSVEMSVTAQAANGHRVVELTVGVTGGGSDAVDASNAFAKVFGTFSRRANLGRNTLQLRAAWQATPNALLPNTEQFSLGGMERARGIPAGEIVGDVGYYLSAQIERSVAGGWNVFAFADHGAAYPYKGDDEGVTPEEFVTTVGLGTEFQLFGRFSGTLVYGIPLKEDQRPESAPGRLHFQLELAF